MFDHFRILPFGIGIALATLIMSIYKPERQIIHQYPHPKDTGDKIFRDLNKTCYTYKVHEVDCDKNESTLRDYPIQG